MHFRGEVSCRYHHMGGKPRGLGHRFGVGRAATVNAILLAHLRPDRLCANIISAMTTHMSQHSAEVAAGLRVIRVAKNIERIADHATHVAEEVIFMVRADDVRHGQWQALGRTRNP